MSDYIDRQGQPISFETWDLLRWDPLYKILEVHKINDLKIITSWNGDLGVMKNFESRVYDAQDQEREYIFYSSEKLAKSGHEKLLKKYNTLNLTE